MVRGLRWPAAGNAIPPWRIVCIRAPVAEMEDALDERVGKRKVCAEDGSIRLSQVPDCPLVSERVCKRVIFVKTSSDNGEGSNTENHAQDDFVLQW